MTDPWKEDGHESYEHGMYRLMRAIAEELCLMRRAAEDLVKRYARQLK